MKKLDFTGFEKMEHLEGPLTRYLEHGLQPGSFLTAVLENNLVEAVGKADAVNKLYLTDIVMFIHNRIPSGSWGHKGVVEEWQEMLKGA